MCVASFNVLLELTGAAAGNGSVGPELAPPLLLGNPRILFRCISLLMAANNKLSQTVFQQGLCRLP